MKLEISISYWNTYERAKKDDEYEIGDKVYYYSTKHSSTRLKTNWEIQSTIIEKRYNSHKLGMIWKKLLLQIEDTF